MLHHKNPGDFIREARQKAGKTQSDIAWHLGYKTSQFISNWERGLSFPPMDIVPDLAKFLKVSRRDLINIIFSSKLAQVEEARDAAMKRRRA